MPVHLKQPAAPLELVLRAATVTITPAPGHPLAGYVARDGRGAIGTHDPLQAGLICLTLGDQAVAWLTLDAIAVDVALAEKLRAVIGTGLGVPPDSVVVCASHTHSGPAGWTGALHPADSEVRENELVADLVNAVAHLAERAAATATPVEAHWCLISAPGVGTNRHRVDGWHDDRTGVLALRATVSGEVRALLFDHASHPTVLGPDNLLWSADWPGAARRVLEASLAEISAIAGPSVCSGDSPVVGFLQGPAGDASPRLLRRGRDFAEVARLGALLGGSVLHAVHRTARSVPTVIGPQVHRGSARLPIRPGPDPTHAARVLTDAEVAWRQLAATPDAPAGRMAASRLEGARRHARLAEASLPPHVDLPISVVVLGGLAWVHLPVELFGSLGGRIVDASPFDVTRIVGYTDGYFGYVADPQAHQAGTYEALSSLFTAEASDALVARATELVHDAYGKAVSR